MPFWTYNYTIGAIPNLTNTTKHTDILSSYNSISWTATHTFILKCKRIARAIITFRSHEEYIRKTKVLYLFNVVWELKSKSKTIPYSLIYNFFLPIIYYKSINSKHPSKVTTNRIWSSICNNTLPNRLTLHTFYTSLVYICTHLKFKHCILDCYIAYINWIYFRLWTYC